MAEMNIVMMVAFKMVMVMVMAKIILIVTGSGGGGDDYGCNGNDGNECYVIVLIM